MITAALVALALAAPMNNSALAPARSGAGAYPGPLERGGIPEHVVPGRALVKLKGIDAQRLELPRADDVAAKTALTALGKRSGVTLDLVRAVFLGWALVEVRDASAPAVMPTEAQTEAMVAQLARDAAVETASPEHWWKKLAVPNDPGMGQMWHFDAIGAEQAWDVTVGDSNQRIGIADTGLLRTHEDVGNRAVNGFDFVTDGNAANDGTGRDGNFNDPGDSCQGEPSSFHGTHVAGTIGAAADNGRGVAGLNWNAGLVIARVLGRCGGSDVDIMEGAAWLAGGHINGVPDVGVDKVSVMNLSLGGANACSSFDQQIVNFVDGQGTTFVAAAGNDAGPVGSPANCNKVITVAAFGPTGSIAGYSSFGSEVEIVGPGGDESFGQAAGVLSSIGPQAGGYAFLQGTSMATPHVVGAISLLQSVAPNLTRAQIVAALQAGGQTCSGCGGVAMLDIPAALTAVGAQSGTPTQPPPPPPSSSADDAFEENDDLGSATVAACGVDDASLIAAPDDRDVFTLVPPAGATIAVAIHALNGADLDLYVVDMQGNVLARSESTTGDERITGSTSGQKLGLVVNPYTDANTGIHNTGGYRLTITCSSTATAQSEDFVPGDAGDPVSDDVTGGSLDGSSDDAGGGDVGDDDLVGGEKPASPEAPPPANDALSQHHGPIATGGCASSGAEPAATGALALVVLALVTRRRRPAALEGRRLCRTR